MHVTQIRVMMLAIISLLVLGTTARGSAVAQGAMVGRQGAMVDKGTVIEAARVAQPPVIDGKLDDAAWAAAKPTSGFLLQNTTIPAKYQTSARVLYDDAVLYIGMHCAEPDIASIKQTKAARDGRIFNSDCVEIMLDPARSGNDFYHIAVSVLGDIFDRACTQGGFIGDVKWDAEIQTATFIGKDFWSVEIAIPFYSLGLTPKVGPVWNINLCREKKSPAENSSIGERGAFNIAGSFAELRGMNADFSDFTRHCYSLGAPEFAMNVQQGALNVKLEALLKNEGDKSGKALLSCRLISPSQKTYTASAEIDSAPGEARVPVGDFHLTEEGDYIALIQVNDAVTKRPLAMRRDTLAIKCVSIRMIEPWYRNALFFTQNLKEVILDVEIRMKPDEASQTSLEVSLRSGKEGKDAAILQSKTVPAPQKQNRIVFDAATLPEGKMTITAVLKQKDGKTLAETAHPLLKLPRRTGEVWLGKDMNWRVDGKLFCINGAWNGTNDFLKEYNVFTSEMPGDVKYIGCDLMWSGFKATFGTRIQAGTLNAGDLERCQAAVRKLKDKPKLFAYYLSDEPECSGDSERALEQIYAAMRDEDPYHPVLVSNDSLNGLESYARSSEINGLHLYPPILKDRQINDLSSVAQGAESGVAFFRNSEHKQTILQLHQGFNYGDYGAVNQRIPNYLEYRSQNILAVICGAKGWLQFNRSVAHYPELYIGMLHLTRELKYLESVVLAPDAAAKPTASSDTVKMLLKDVEGELYLLACNASMKPCETKLAIPGVGKKAKSLNVISENRHVTVNGDTFTDKFDTFEVHIYTTASKKPDLLAVAEICKLIDEANAKRKKPGNLAFQMFEGDGVTVSASSKQGDYRRPDNGLWHVVDGVIDTDDHYKTLTWQDKTNNEFPDWLEIQLPEAQTIGRVVVYPFQKSLKDYAVQGWLNGEWKDLDKVTGKNDEIITHTFAPIKTDRIRLFVTAANGPNAMVTEIEVYEK